jgi:hypothetical protein
MIIYGTRGKNVRTGGGEFTCPRCACEQSYKHFEVKNYFTLYFIPLIPMGNAGEFVECEGCGGTFAPEILTYDPEAEREETAATLRRLSVLFLLDVNRCTSTTLKALQEIVGDTVGIDIERTDVAKDVEQAQSASPDVRKFFKTQTTEYSDDGKLLLIITLRRILESECPLLENEKSRITELGKAIGLRAKHIKEALEMDLDASE